MSIVVMTVKRRIYAGQSAEERAQARRERLIEAAIDVYGTVGYRNATVKAVCEAAGLTERYFYESFENSEALLIAAFDLVAHDVLRHLDELRTACDRPPHDCARAVLEAYYQILKDNPAGARLYVVEIARVGPSVDEVLERWMQEFGELLALTMSPQQPSAAKRNALLRAGAAGAVVQIARNWIRGNFTQSVTAVADDALAFCRVLEGDA
jgi:AcrR family transcriptional regulator